MFIKKFTALIMVLVISVSFFACAKDEETYDEEDKKTSQSKSVSKKDDDKKDEDIKEDKEDTSNDTLKLNEINNIDGYATFSLQSVTTAPEIFALNGRYGHYANSTTGNIYIDAVFEVKNISDGVIDYQKFMTAYATNDEGKKYKAELFGSEDEERTVVIQTGNINPGETAYFHAAISVPSTQEVYGLTFKIKEKEYKITYKLNETLKKVTHLRVGDMHENPDYATLEFLNLEFSDELIAEKGDSPRHKVDNSNDTLMLLTFNITNFTEGEKSCADLITLFPLFDKKYTYEYEIFTEERDGEHLSKNGYIAPLATRKVVVMIEIPKAAAEKSYEIRTIFDNKEFMIK